MKNILILSDTHGYMDDRILVYAETADEIWHGGDIGDRNVANLLESKSTLMAVYGNIDGAENRSRFREHLFFKCEELKILIIHIAGQFGKYNQTTKTLLRQYRPDILVCGHSHILKIAKSTEFSCLHINPGAAGISGFHQIRTLVRCSIDGKQISAVDVIELGQRSKSAQSIG